LAVFAVMVLMATLAAACADLERGPAPARPEAGAFETGLGTAEAGTGAAETFAAVRPLLVAGCARCHAAGREAAMSALVFGDDAGADYRSVRALVDLGNPAASRLLGKGAGQGHGGGVVWSAGSAEHARILAWISGGARP
jgi:hypothetical protein